MKYGTKNKVHERRAAFLFILPAVLLLAAFLILPAVSTVRYAFTDYNILRPDKIKFCGLDNFVELFWDRDFKKSLVNTIYFTVVVVPVYSGPAFSPADFIQEKGSIHIPGSLFQPQHHFHGGGCHPLERAVQSQSQHRTSERISHKAGLCPLRFPDRPQDVHEFHYLHVGLAGGRVSDDDFPGRTSGHTGRPV